MKSDAFETSSYPITLLLPFINAIRVWNRPELYFVRDRKRTRATV